MTVRTVIKNSRKEIVAAVILIGSFAVLLGIAANEYPDLPPLTKVSESTPGSLPPCAEEDSDNCYWDADTMGNGQGDDIVSP